MLINPISSSQNKTYFRGGQKPDVLKNQLRILLTQDIWAQKLRVKYPESEVEKEVLLEILKNRAKLDRFARLTNQKFEIRTTSNYVKHLEKTNPEDKSLPELIEKLKIYGNIETTLNTIDKKIELEAKKNKPALDYFKNIENIEEDYLNKHLIKFQKMDKFWHQVRKNNINKDMKYSTKELIDIIEQGKPAAVTTANAAKIKPSGQLSKKDFIARIERQYEQFLRENVDIYNEKIQRFEKAQKAQSLIYTENIDGFKRYPDVQKSLGKIFDTVQNKYMFKVNRILGIDIYPIGEIFKDMYVVEDDMNNLLKEIKLLNQELQTKPDNTELKKALEEAKQALEVHKKDWLTRLEYSMKYEKFNRQKFAEAGREAEYGYLVDKNIVLNKYKKAFEIFEENNNLTNEELEAAIN